MFVRGQPALVFLLCALAACAGSQTGGVPDSDGGSISDAGSNRDGGAGSDAGSNRDAGNSPDGGALDGGSPDGGSSADAGALNDGGDQLQEGAAFPLDPYPAQCGPSLIDSFESSVELASWQAATWAEVTLDANGNPAQLSATSAGATDGSSALSVPVRFTGAGYQQGYVGRADLNLSLAGCATLALDVTLPSDAPAGLNGSLILLLGAQAAWNGQVDEVALSPGNTVTVRLPLSAGIEPVPDRSLFKQLVGLGFKIDGSNVTWSGNIYIDNLRTESMTGPSAADLDAFPVGNYGGFIDADGGVENPAENGFLTFTADTTVQGHSLRWPMLNADGSDFIFGTAYFGDTNSTGAGGAPIFHDWTTLEAQQSSDKASASVLMSRAFPAARYTSNTKLFIWQTADSTRAAMPRMALVQNGQINVIHLDQQPEIDLSSMSEPWLLLWAGSASGWSFDVPTLITFQHKPIAATQTTKGLEFAFSNAMDSVQVMPLYGLARQANSDTTAWDSSLSGDAIVQARAFVSILAAFPTATTESYAVDEQAGTVTITDSDSHQLIADDWGTQPTPAAAIPPAVYHAGLNGYPVTYPDGAPIESEVATWFGPYAYRLSSSVRYTIPLPFGLTRSPIALRVLNSAATAPIRAQLEQILSQQVPTDPGSYWLSNDESDADFACDGWSTFDPAGEVRATAGSIGPRMAENTLLSRSVAIFTDPVTNQQYLGPTSYPESDLPFDKEWNTGRQLASLTRCAEAVDLDIARGAWAKILATYRYHRIYFDWATGSVLSSTLGLTELADGMHFAWDGMLGVGRLARKLGDEQTWNDVAYRTARQQAALYNAWYQGQWVQSIDYGIGHITNAKLPASQVETRGAVDGYVEAFGCSTLEFQSFWETTNYLYFDVPAQLSLYRDYGLEERVHTLEYQIMPAAHPDWTNGNVLDPVDQRYYGSNYTSAHLVARALLFNDDPAALFTLYNSAQGTMAASQWYTMYFHGLAGPTLLSIERAQAPLVEAPLAGARIASSTYDARSNQVAIDFQALTTGSMEFRTRAPGGAFVVHTVSTQAGHRYLLTMTP